MIINIFSPSGDSSKLRTIFTGLLYRMLLSFSRDELRELAVTHGIKRGRNKTDTIQELIVENKKLSIRMTVEIT